MFSPLQFNKTSYNGALCVLGFDDDVHRLSSGKAGTDDWNNHRYAKIFRSSSSYPLSIASRLADCVGFDTPSRDQDNRSRVRHHRLNM